MTHAPFTAAFYIFGTIILIAIAVYLDLQIDIFSGLMIADDEVLTYGNANRMHHTIQTHFGLIDINYLKKK